MTETMSDVITPTDAELISRVRGGDTAAYGELFDRHRDAATRLSRQLVRDPESDDLVSEAFVKVLQVLRGGGGPDVAFRAYLLTAVRRLHIDRVRSARRVQPTDELEQHDPGIPFQDTAVDGFERSVTARAFASLPERWQLVLWHVEVEGSKPAEVAPLLGISPNSVSALAYRAREGLRQAYLQMHLADTAGEHCRWTTEHLGAYVRGGLARRDAHRVDDHLEECRRCTGVYLELAEVNSNLRGLLAPLLLGTLAPGYLASTAAVGAGTAFGFGALLDRLTDGIKGMGANAAVAGAVVTTAVAGIVTAVVISNSGVPENIRADPVVTPTPQVASPAPSAPPSSEPSAPPSPTPPEAVAPPAAPDQPPVVNPPAVPPPAEDAPPAAQPPAEDAPPAAQPPAEDAPPADIADPVEPGTNPQPPAGDGPAEPPGQTDDGRAEPPGKTPPTSASPEVTFESSRRTPLGDIEGTLVVDAVRAGDTRVTLQLASNDQSQLTTQPASSTGRPNSVSQGVATGRALPVTFASSANTRSAEIEMHGRGWRCSPGGGTVAKCTAKQDAAPQLSFTGYADPDEPATLTATVEAGNDSATKTWTFDPIPPEPAIILEADRDDDGVIDGHVDLTDHDVVPDTTVTFTLTGDDLRLAIKNHRGWDCRTTTATDNELTITCSPTAEQRAHQLTIRGHVNEHQHATLTATLTAGDGKPATEDKPFEPIPPEPTIILEADRDDDGVIDGHVDLTDHDVVPDTTVTFTLTGDDLRLAITNHRGWDCSTTTAADDELTVTCTPTAERRAANLTIRGHVNEHQQASLTATLTTGNGKAATDDKPFEPLLSLSGDVTALEHGESNQYEVRFDSPDGNWDGVDGVSITIWDRNDDLTWLGKCPDGWHTTDHHQLRLTCERVDPSSNELAIEFQTRDPNGDFTAELRRDEKWQDSCRWRRGQDDDRCVAVPGSETMLSGSRGAGIG